MNITTNKVIQMLKTVATVTSLGNNKFLIKWGLNSETVIQVEEDDKCSVCSGNGLDITLGQVGTCNACGGTGFSNNLV